MGRRPQRSPRTDTLFPDTTLFLSERVLEASHAIVESCVSLGGTLSGEHGIGSEKRDFMPLIYNEDDLCAMAGLKRAFDPDARFNPQKVDRKSTRLNSSH